MGVMLLCTDSLKWLATISGKPVRQLAALLDGAALVGPSKVSSRRTWQEADCRAERASRSARHGAGRKKSASSGEIA